MFLLLLLDRYFFFMFCVPESHYRIYNVLALPIKNSP